MLERLRSLLRTSRSPKYRWLWYAAAALIYGAVLALPLPGFDFQAKKAFALFSLTAFLWGTNTLPLAVTGIVVLFLMPFTGVLSYEQTYAYFGNRAVFFILGTFILASPVSRSGLSTRLALGVVSRFGKSTGALLASVLGIGAVMSFAISAHAVAAMLLPVILEVVRSTGSKPGGRFSSAMFLAMAWGPVIGSCATLLGGARAPLALGLLQSTTGKSIGFLQWILGCMPTVLVLLLFAYAILAKLGRDESISLKTAQRFLKVRSRQLGSISRREIYTVGILSLTILLWVIKGETWGLDTVAFLGVLLAFILGVADWKEVEEDVNWGIFMMYGSAIALSAALEQTGVASTLAQLLLTSGIKSVVLVFVAVVVLVMFLTEVMSNAAAVAVLIPVVLAIAGQYDLDPRAMTLAVTLPAGLGFLLPVSTPAIAIVIGSGYVSPAEVFRQGIKLKLVGFLVFLVISWLYWPLVGFGGNSG